MPTKELETEILRDIYKFVTDYSDCPPMDSEDSDRYWEKVSQRMTSLFQKYEGKGDCKLAVKMGITVFEYLEYKAYRKTAEGKKNAKAEKD